MVERPFPTKILRNEVDFMEQQNGNFICKCALCGGAYNFLSEVTMHPNYGSAYDGEQVTIPLCGDCFDEQYRHVRAVLPKWVEIKETI